MKAFFTSLALATALVPWAFSAETAPEGILAEEYLFKVGVDRGKFVSLIPPAFTNVFEKDAPRKEAWKRRVAEKIGGGIKAEKVDVRLIGDEVGVYDHEDMWHDANDDRWLANWMDDGAPAVSVVRTKTDKGETVVRTNRFSLVRYDSSHSEDCGVRLLDGGDGRGLRADCGVGESAWVLAWADLEKRWNAEKDVEKVRKAWKAIRDGKRCEEGAPGGKAWGSRLDEYWKGHRELWGGIDFVNERDEEIEIRYRVKGNDRWNSPIKLAAKETKAVEALQNPRGGGYEVEWQFRPAGPRFRFEDSKTQDFAKIDVDVRNDVIFIRNDLAPFNPPPKMRFTDQVFDGEGFVRLVPRLSVGYEDDNGNLTNTVAEVYLDALTNAVAELLPGMTIKGIGIDGDGEWYGKQTFALEKSILNCGDDVKAPRLTLLPWPELKIENTAPAKVAVRIVQQPQSGGGGNPRSLSIDSGKNATKALEDWLGTTLPPTSREAQVRITAEAENYDPWSKVIDLHRGQKPVSERIVLKAKSLPWPDDEEVRRVFKNCSFLSVILTPNPTTKVGNVREVLNEYFKAVDDAVAADVDTHLLNCKKQNCDQHGGFLRKHDQDLKGKRGRERKIELFVALWSDVYPRVAPKEYSAGKTKAERLRELLQNYIAE